MGDEALADPAAPATQVGSHGYGDGIDVYLIAKGYLTRTREGRRNRCGIIRDLPLRHELEHNHSVGELLTALGRLGDRGDEDR